MNWYFLLTALLLIAKVTGHFPYSWLWVVLPASVSLAFGLLAFVGFVISSILVVFATPSSKYRR